MSTSQYRQKWLAVIDLKDTTKVKTDRKLGRTSKYEVKAVLWNPHHVNKDLLVSTVSVPPRPHPS